MAKGLVEGWYMVREETLQSFLFKVGDIDGDAPFSDIKGNLQVFITHFISVALCR